MNIFYFRIIYTYFRKAYIRLCHTFYFRRFPCRAPLFVQNYFHIFALVDGGYLRRPPPFDEGFEAVREGAEGAELFAAARAGACVCFTEVVFGEDV